MRAVFASILGLALCLMPIAARAEAPSAALVAWLEGEMASAGIPGASIAVVRDFEISWAAGFGESDQAHHIKVTPATLFQAASVSKPIAALAMLIALDERVLNIDMPVNDLLDRFAGDPSIAKWRLPNPFATQVTIRMLLMLWTAPPPGAQAP
ncbi:MAG: beta-lactamase family protein [Rhizobiales bacterium]|nr:beta-lactamase family protein [Hyphomicrobiales bacterium]